jgi:hypothetical protein
MKLSAAVLLAVLALFLAAACGTVAKSGVQGVAIISGRPANSGNPTPTYPDRAALVVVHQGAANGKVVAKVRPNRAGAFRVDLAPGSYTLVQWGAGSVPASISLINAPTAPVSKRVTVKPGQYAKVTLKVSMS